MNKKYNQITLTKFLADRAKNLSNQWQESWPALRQILWYNPTDENSLRLSHAGYSFFKKHGYKSYEITLENKVLANKHLLILERYFPSVYMLVNAKKIILFDEEYVSLIILMNNDVALYLENLVQSVDQK